MLANQSQEEQPTNQNQKELNQSKNIIKEALLSNPGLLKNIIINLEEKQNEQPNQVVQQSPLDVFQQPEENQETNNKENENQQANEQKPQRQNQIYQFEEQETPQESNKQQQIQKVQKNTNREIKARCKERNDKNKTSKGSSNKNKKPTTNEQYWLQQQEQQQVKDEKQQENKVYVPNFVGKKSSEKAIGTQSQKHATKYNKTIKDDQKIHKKTPSNKTQILEKCSFQIYMKDDKELQRMLSQKSKKIEKSIQKQKKLQSVIFWLEIALLTDRKSMKMLQEKYKTMSKNQPEENFEQAKADYYQEQSKTHNNLTYYEDQEQEQSFSKNRKKNNQKINLGTLSLLQIVTILKNEELLKYSLYNQFKNNHSVRDLDEFIKRFTAGQLATFNYKLIPFTLLDHRRLSELIFNLFPDKYYIGEIYSENEEVFNFLVSCYDLQSDKYYKLYKNIDQLSKIQWWKELIVDNKKRIDQAFKIKNAYKRNPQTREQYRKNFDEKLRQKRKKVSQLI